MRERTYTPGQKVFKFTFQLNPDHTPSQQMTKMKLAFDRAITNYFSGKQPEIRDDFNKPEHY